MSESDQARTAAGEAGDDVVVRDEAQEDPERHLLRDTGADEPDMVDNTIVPPG